MIAQEELIVQVDVWGEFACFSPPYARVERLTSPVPTPSAIRGILDAIYIKPLEFKWQVEKIEVMRPIRYMNFRMNEVKKKQGKARSEKDIVNVEEERTQRQTICLHDVYYRVTARIVPKAGFEHKSGDLLEQAERRITGGKCFYQPYLGMRNFTGYFSLPNGEETPIHESQDFGLMLYDVFDFTSTSRFADKGFVKPNVSLYHCTMKDGVILVPPYESNEVIKGVRINA